VTYPESGEVTEISFCEKSGLASTPDCKKSETGFYKNDRIPVESDQISIWFDVPREPACGLDILMEQVRDFGGSGIAVPFEYIR
jgi:hypothetical protein